LEIRKEIVINASCLSIYSALTNEDKILKYYPLQKVVADWQSGGRIIFIGKESGIDEGVIEQLEENRLFRFSYWNKNHGRDNLPENQVMIEYLMEDTKDGSLLTLTQSNIPGETYAEIMDPVWDYLLGSLKKFVEDE
jgi:uncharacterized protein YndB with AHSA1/START domain